MTNLQYLYLSGNQLSGGIPAVLSSLTNLQTLYLPGNQLSGGIPAVLSSLTNLQYLDLGSNPLGGTIPSSLGSMTNLRSLNLYNNQLTGTLPPELANLTNLQTLYLPGNQLSGNIPTSLGGLSKLVNLALNSNQLTGPIPAELGNLANLQYLELGSNPLSGSIPTSLGSLANLRYLYLYNSQITGAIPGELGNLTNLQTLYLGNNPLSGSIPAGLGNLANLRSLYLGSNRLTGAIPAELASLTSLQYLSLSGNQLGGPIPSSLAGLVSLNGADFRWNALYSTDGSLISFLNSKQSGGNWQSYQTVAPTSIQAAAQSSTSILVSWARIAYTQNTGRYQVWTSLTSGGPYTCRFHHGQVGFQPPSQRPKSLHALLLVVRTVTDPHGNNPNMVTSEPSAEVSATTQAAPAPAVSLSPATLIFPDTPVGSTSTARTFTLTNTGNVALNITSISASGDFQTNNCGASLAATASCSVNVTFTPVASGSRSGTVSIASNAPGSPHTVSLSGNGVVFPVASLSAAGFDFGMQPVGPAGATQTLTIANSGNGSLVISSLALAGANPADFRFGSLPLPITVPQGNYTTIVVQFAPTDAGSRSASLTITDNAAGSPHSVSLNGIGATASLLAWGENGNGQLGNGTTALSRTPVQVSGLHQVLALAGKTTHSLALKVDGTVWSWGKSGNGELGTAHSQLARFLSRYRRLRTRAESLRATTIVWLPGATAHSGLGGSNAIGQLGLGNLQYTTTPLQVSSLSQVIAVAAGDFHSLAVKADGTLWSFGQNGSGQLGNGTTTFSTVPVQVTSLAGVVEVAGGSSHSLALMSDGTVWAWGLNTSGQLGNGTTASSSVPVQVSGLTGVLTIAAGSFHSMALKSDGTVWA